MQIRELDKLVTADAPRVMMAFLIIKMFKMMVLFSKGGLTDDPRLQKFFKDTIDGRPRDLTSLALALLQEFFRREMPVGMHDLVENDAAPARELQSAAVEVIFIFFLLVNDHVMIQCLIWQSKVKGSFLFYLTCH